jgi:hypothetical protein
MMKYLAAFSLLCLFAMPALAQDRIADPAPIRQTPFPDVPRSHWAFDAVEKMRTTGIMRGYPPSGKFNAPSSTATAPRTKPATSRRSSAQR